MASTINSKKNLCSIICGILAERGETLYQSGHGHCIHLEVAHFYVPRCERLGRCQQQLLRFIRLFFLFAVQKPVGNKFQLDVLYSIVVQDTLHILEASSFKYVLEISLFDPNALKARPGRSYDPVFEIKRAVLRWRVRMNVSGDCPVRSQQFYVCHNS